ncbi:MAG TPA: polysaccharide biosynthesis/export family protein, partial [Gemmatimonadaceae bacterium]|nr:polysaccharide biosynthesis/export family protein [Gemmatimonadaceae bacterium]
MSKGFLRAAFAAFALSGCAMPGLRYEPPVGTAPEPARPAYSVQRITPQLLAGMRSAAVDTPLVSAPLEQALSNYTYRVGPHDVLNIIVWNHPELTLSQAQSAVLGGLTGSLLVTPPMSGGSGFEVDSRGNIFFPYAGTLHVAGKSVDEIRLMLQQGLQDYSKNPQVNVTVVTFRSETYQLAGAVMRPGLYSLTNVPLTVSQAIVSAGGEIRSVPTSGAGTITDLTSLPLADLSHVTLISGSRREVLDLRRFYEFGDQTQDRLVHPGDIIQVPNNTDDYVHVVGEVLRQGNYPIAAGRLNLAQALGSAGGVNLVTSDPARIFVFRGAYDAPQVYWLDARSADAMLLATQFQLEPQDVV